ncbi:MAG: hypothetical protein QOI66_3915 [Myxococcales bacterium]|jgi:hypothetical protein|nr:hypothetical protein [Myxococcales bacterium]
MIRQRLWPFVVLACASLGCSGGGSAGGRPGGTGGQRSDDGAIERGGSGGGGESDGAGGGGTAGRTGDDVVADLGVGDVASGAGGASGEVGGSDLAVETAAPSTCPAGATLCEDFEGYADGATSLAPKWETYTLSAAIKVDGSKPHAGSRALHLTTQAGASHFADIIKQSQDGSAVLPKAHFGRVMLWTATVPPDAHWGINHAAGPTATDRRMQLKYSHGGQFGKLFAGYSQRQRPVNPDGTFPPRGGGVEPGDPPTTVDCYKRAAVAVLPLRKWVCWEWKFDANASETHLWVDSNPITDLDAVGRGTGCVAPLPGDTAWQGPVLFNKLILGFDQYQDAPAQEVWMDDLVIGPDRVGCP